MINSYKAIPVSRRDIRRLAGYLRCITRTEKDEYLDIMKLIEFDMPALVDGFELVILPSEQMENCCGYTTPGERRIVLSEDIYVKAHSGDGYARFSVAHELGHLFLHDPASITLCRLKNQDIKTYEDPEWQADAFGGELLMYYPLVKYMGPLEMASKCGVTKSAAKMQYSRLKL